MNISNRIYSRKVLYRLVYMYNFFASFLKDEKYNEIAYKVENIVEHGIHHIKENQNIDFSSLVILNKKRNFFSDDVNDYIRCLNPENEECFQEWVTYTQEYFVKSKYNETLDYKYIVNNMYFLVNKFDLIKQELSSVLETFKFNELNSVDQSILLLGYIENKVENTPKAVIIKECLFLSSTFGSENSPKLINAVLDKIL